MKVKLKSCCSWDDFQKSFNFVVEREKFPMILIDQKKVKRCWRMGMIGHEAFITVTKDEKQQAMDIQNAEFFRRFKANQ